jgi:hypothetical protein
MLVALQIEILLATEILCRQGEFEACTLLLMSLRGRQRLSSLVFYTVVGELGADGLLECYDCSVACCVVVVGGLGLICESAVFVFDCDVFGTGCQFVGGAVCRARGGTSLLVCFGVLAVFTGQGVDVFLQGFALAAPCHRKRIDFLARGVECDRGGVESTNGGVEFVGALPRGLLRTIGGVLVLSHSRIGFDVDFIVSEGREEVGLSCDVSESLTQAFDRLGEVVIGEALQRIEHWQWLFDERVVEEPLFDDRAPGGVEVPPISA